MMFLQLVDFLVQRVDVGSVLVRFLLRCLCRGERLIGRRLRMLHVVHACATACENGQRGNGDQTSLAKYCVHIVLLDSNKSPRTAERGTFMTPDRSLRAPSCPGFRHSLAVEDCHHW